MNGDFESGGLSGWTIFTTPNGDLGSYASLPQVSAFDVDGDGLASDAAVFQAGEAVFIPPAHTSEGGGIFQSFDSAAGVYSVHASIAAYDAGPYANDKAGIFTLLLDGNVVDRVDMEQIVDTILPGQIIRSSIDGTISLATGVHELRLLITREVLNGSVTPFQYLDGIEVVAVPEPAAASLASLACLAWFVACARRRTSSRRSRKS